MSGAARKRGAGRASRGGPSSETSSRRGDRSGQGGFAGGFDGPASRGSASNMGTGHATSPNAPQGGSTPQNPPTASRRSSQSGSGAAPNQPAAPLGDPARDRRPRYTDQLRNVDFPPSFYNIDQEYALPTDFAKRPGFNTTGKAVQVALNAYQVAQYPTAKVYQYDVTIGNGLEKRIVQRKIWDSQARKNATGPPMLYDGNRLAWSLRDHSEIRLMIDLDVEAGRPASREGRNAFRLHIKKTREVDISLIQQYLTGRIQYGQEVAECVNFMDHLLREGPNSNPQFLTVRRSLFKRQGQRSDLGGSVEVWRGVYQSMRMAEGQKLIINLDVANTCFWKPGSLLATIITRWGMQNPSVVAAKLAPRGNGTPEESYEHATIRKGLKGVMVVAQYKGNPFPNKEWKIHTISMNNAHQEQLEWKDPVTKRPTGEKLSVAQYFQRKYNVALQFPNLPLVEMTKKGVKYPLELLQVLPGSRYLTKLDEIQTANMIKFAVSLPHVRLQAINEGKSWLNWDGDSYLKNYGLRINPDPIKTNARVLPAPGVKFANKVQQPGAKGRWDLRGCKFLNRNPQELTSWGIGFFPGRLKPDKPALDKFALDFTRAYREHGGQVANHPPVMMPLKADVGQAVNDLYQATGNKFQRRPQLLIFLLQDRQAFHYLRIKKSMDCRFGIVSQCMQLQQVLKGNPQYYSNVLMKVNAKLGGSTAQAVSHPSSGFKGFNKPTMIIGADVSHASPGSEQASMAAITVSFDRFAGRYAAACQTNGRRVEMITENNWKSMLKPLVNEWMSQVGGGAIPSQVYYIRDGVSEGQFIQVMRSEVPHIRSVLSECNNNKAWNGTLTVVIAGKRHHVRAFPGKDAGDQKGNPLPGCLIERDVTSPYEFDFYLYSHTALQGTSRPTHYSIIYDDANHTPNALQNMLYEHCYQYMRSTTSVSLHPAAYYAHLASNRAKAHEDVPAHRGPQGGAGFKMKTPSGSSQPSESEVAPLMPLFSGAGSSILWSMWYI